MWSFLTHIRIQILCLKQNRKNKYKIRKHPKRKRFLDLSWSSQDLDVDQAGSFWKQLFIHLDDNIVKKISVKNGWETEKQRKKPSCYFWDLSGNWIICPY